MRNIRELIKKEYNKISPTYRSIRRLEKRTEELNSYFDQRLDALQTMLWYFQFRGGESLIQKKRDFFMSLPKAEGTLRRVQLVGVYMLRLFKDLCEKNGITYWISYGTLLGAVRHKGFIPWDDDIDISLLREDFEKLCIVLKNDRLLELRSYYYEEGFCFLYKVVFRGFDDTFWLDIVVWDYADTKLLGQLMTWRNITDLRTRTLHEVAKESRKFKKRYDHELLSYEDEETLIAVFNKCRAEMEEIKEPDSIYRGFDSVYLGGESLILLDEIFPLCELNFEGDVYPGPCQYEKILCQGYHYLDFPKNIGRHRLENADYVAQIETEIRHLGLGKIISDME